MIGAQSLERSSAVNTATTPGAALAASVSIRTMVACGCSLRRIATCSARSGLRSAAYSPLPVNRRGSSVRRIGIPTWRGRSRSEVWTMSSLLIRLRSLAQALPLRVIMAADDGDAGFLDAADLGKGLQKRLGVPGIAGHGIRIEILPQAHRIRHEQERTIGIEIDFGSHRPRRVAGQRNQDQSAVAEHVALAIHGIGLLSVVPVGAEISGGFRPGSAGRLDLPGMHHDGCLLEELVAAAMIGME